MNKKYKAKGAMMVLLIAIVLQAGFSVYSMIDDGGYFHRRQVSLLADENISTAAVTLDISQEIKDIIMGQYPDSYSAYLEKYQQFLTGFTVSPALKSQVEALLKDGYRLGNVMTGYDFLYHGYGTMAELKNMLAEQQRGQSWTALFRGYHSSNNFIPRAFDGEYLERLTQTPGITSDDIMIADRISQKSGIPFETLIHRMQEGESWRQITEAEGILNGSSTLPRVQVTQEKLQSYGHLGLSEDSIVEGLVLAYKQGLTEAAVLELAAAGKTQEEILMAGYQEKYQ